MNKDTIESFFHGQLEAWPEVAERYKQLADQEIKYVRSNRMRVYKIICNPMRSASVTADTRPSPVTHNACPLCVQNRPPEQQSLVLGDGYTLLVNPYPVFHRHFTITSDSHLPQQIDTRFADLLSVAREMEGYAVYYNGPEAGASIPQHVHFQAAPADDFPVKRKDYISLSEKLLRHKSAILYKVVKVIPYFLITATDIRDASVIFNTLFESLDDKEKRMNNIIARYKDGEWHISIYIRRKHRPDIYYADNKSRIIVSPGTIEMAGIVVTIDPESHKRLDRESWETILREITITPERINEIPKNFIKVSRPYQIHIGILETPVIVFDLLTPYLLNGAQVQGPQKAEYQDGSILYNGVRYTELLFVPSNEENACIQVSGVTIGKEFHWQQERTQQFTGSWRILPADGKLVGINILDTEEYLKSVVSSEMSANAPLELLKAHAVIARSWLTRMIERRTTVHSCQSDGLIWHEAEEHTLYDVCADDHCQRYQGITQITNQAATQAVDATRGKIITYEREVIDARYSKCCGGVTEEYSTAWGNIDYPYLAAVRDTAANLIAQRSWIDRNIDKWVNKRAKAWCNVTDPDTIRMILNDYDRETTDFYRWQVSYSAVELADIIRKKTGTDPGQLLSIEPLERGVSGRIWKLRIVGSLNTCVIGKELEIRRVLAPTHLYSSAFTVETLYDDSGTPVRFILHGAGWGHGVGLCQIGAANMAVHGYIYEQIISHYYKKTDIIQKYE